MKIFLSVIALTLLLLGLASLLPSPQSPEIGDSDNFLPWQIRLDAEGQSEVFGLKPGVSTLQDARQRFGDKPELGIIAAPNEIGALEAYYAQVDLGPLQGRLILTLDVLPETLKTMRERAVKAEYMESVTRRIRLAPEDVEAANRTPLAAISFIPGANLDEDVLKQRFGEPAEVIRVSETLTHYLYPDKGLDVVHDAKGREILQYVAPREFETRIREPLCRNPVPASDAKP